MEVPTHYSVLGLNPSAPDAVVRAAYKALVLIHHPDKTLHLPADERARHAAIFNNVQQAYDVLNGPSKRAYDAELARHGNRVDLGRSTFHRAPEVPKATPAMSNTSTPIRLTTREEKRAMRAKAEEDLAYLRQRRYKQESQDANMDIAGSEAMHKIWTDLLYEHQKDLSMRTICIRRVKEYESMISVRETFGTPRKDTGPQARSATPNAESPRRPPPKPTASSASARAPPPPLNMRQREERRKRAEAEREEEAYLRAQARAEDKARKDAARQADADAKAEAIRVRKETHRCKVEDRARREAEHIANVRAKVAPARKASVGAYHERIDAARHEVRHEKPRSKIVCAKCGSEHASFTAWRTCNRGDPAQRDY